tara:strand:+ start:136 stop:381 length:246 start_codon:yes stop_codon:yes gene_type:complete
MSSISAIAGAIGFEYNELKEYRYYIEGTNRAIYSVENDYLCAGTKDPNKDEALKDFGPWVKHNDQFWAEKYKTIVWISKGE